jgi:hypothetical protein
MNLKKLVYSLDKIICLLSFTDKFKEMSLNVESNHRFAQTFTDKFREIMLDIE